MSIPVRFNFYSASGEFLTERGIFTISYGQRSGDLNLLSSRLMECSVTDHRKYIHPDAKYAVPTSAPDYMFDIDDPSAIMVNIFKERK